jgi:type I restriction enzyme M protein
VRWWILRHCQVEASIDFPVEPFISTVKEFGLTPAMCSFLVLRRRGHEELVRPLHPEYAVFMALIDRAGMDRKGNPLFQRAPDGEELIFNNEVIERVREGGKVQVKHVVRRTRRIDDELPTVSQKFKVFRRTGEVTR